MLAILWIFCIISDMIQTKTKRDYKMLTFVLHDGEYDDIYLIREDQMKQFVYMLIFCKIKGYSYTLK
jgi:hypothetical protein